MILGSAFRSDLSRPHTYVGSDNNVRLVKWRYRITPQRIHSATLASSDKTTFVFNFFGALYALNFAADAW